MALDRPETSIDRRRPIGRSGASIAVLAHSDAILTALVVSRPPIRSENNPRKSFAGVHLRIGHAYNNRQKSSSGRCR
jgi:hypothetical protein